MIPPGHGGWFSRLRRSGPPTQRRPAWPRFTPGVTLILVLNVAVHLAFFVGRLADPETFDSLFRGAALVPDRLPAGEVWRLVTMMFVHDPGSVFHLLMNTLLLYSLGPWVEQAMTLRPFLALYVVAGVAGSLVYSAWAFVFSDPANPAIGASGAVLGVLAAFSLLFPDAQLRLWFLAPLRGRSLIFVALAIDVVVWLSDPQVAIAAHAGGILGAFATIRRPWRRAWRQRFRWRIERFLRLYR